MLKINYKKQYTSHSTFTKKLVPIQSLILDKLAEFSTKIFNLALLNYNKEFENSPNTKLFKNSKYFF